MLQSFQAFDLEQMHCLPPHGFHAFLAEDGAAHRGLLRLARVLNLDASRLWSEYLTHLTYAREYYGQHGCGNLEAWKEATTSDKRGRQPAVLRGALLRYASWCGSSTGVELSGQRKR